LAQIPQVAQSCAFSYATRYLAPKRSIRQLSTRVLLRPLHSRLALYQLSAFIGCLLSHRRRVDDVGVEVRIFQPDAGVWTVTVLPTGRSWIFWIGNIFIKILLLYFDHLAVALPKSPALAECKSRITFITCKFCASIFVPGESQQLPLSAFIRCPAVFMDQDILAHVAFGCLKRRRHRIRAELGYDFFA